MSEKFKNVPVEEDTHILYELEIPLDKYHVLHQKWFWEGIISESIIFANEDVADITDSELENIVKATPLFDKDSEFPFTLVRHESGFTFVNFNQEPVEAEHYGFD